MTKKVERLLESGPRNLTAAEAAEIARALQGDEVAIGHALLVVHSQGLLRGLEQMAETARRVLRGAA
jgi:hypothetical protein